MAYIEQLCSSKVAKEMTELRHSLVSMRMAVIQSHSWSKEGQVTIKSLELQMWVEVK